VNNLWLKVGLQSSGVKTGLNALRGELNSFAGQIKGSLSGALGGAALFAFAAKSLQDLDRASKLATRFGETAETIQRVGAVADLAGSGIEMVAKATSKLTIEAAKAARGEKEQAETFALLNINAAEFVGLPLEDKLVALSRAYVEAQGSADKMATFMELLGNRAQDIIPMLAAGPEELKKQFDAVAVASGSSARAAERFNDTLTSLGHIGRAVFGVIIQSVLSVIDVLGGFGEVMETITNANWSAMKAAATGNLKGVVDAYRNAKKEIEQITASRGAKIRETWTHDEADKNRALKSDFEDSAEKAAEKQKAEKELGDARDALAKRELENQRALMDLDAKRNSLIAERKRLIEEAVRAGWETTEGVKKRTEAAGVTGQIQGVDKDIASKQEQAGKEAETREERMQKLRESNAKAVRDAQFDALRTDRDRLAFLEKEKATINDSIDAAPDEEARLRLEGERTDKQREIDRLRLKPGPQDDGVGDSMRKIGLGGRAIALTAPKTDAAEKSARTLDDIKRQNAESNRTLNRIEDKLSPSWGN
jgi:hypothetical protein